MKISVMLLLLCLLSGSGAAQEYKVSTTQQDVFSIALVKLLNCAADGFKNCKGKLIRSTSLMGDDHQLNIVFPGSAAAVVRIRDWEKNAYIEFRGYTDKQSRIKGVYDIVAKIKKALGDQLQDRYEGLKKDDVGFYGLSIKDRNGFFSMNMEVFSGASSAPIYLLGPEREDETKPASDFVLLKIYGGVPSYQHYIHAIAPPDRKLDTVLRLLIRSAEKDFASPPFEATSATAFKRKKEDTVRVNGIAVYMVYRGANHSAILTFPVNPNSIPYDKQWNNLQRSLEAALGSDYVYQKSRPGDLLDFVFFSKDYIEKKPRVYLMDLPVDSAAPTISIRIESSYTHEVSRGLRIDD